MIWVLIYQGVAIHTGSFWGCIGEAEERDLCLRRQHDDGTEMTPRWTRGLILIPEGMDSAIRQLMLE